MGNAGTRKCRAECEDGGPHRLYKFVRGNGVVESLALDGVGVRGEMLGAHGGRHDCQQLAHGDDIPHLGNVVQSYGFGCQQSSGHRGQRGIFRSADFHRAVQRFAAAYQELIHFGNIPRESFRYSPSAFRRFPPDSLWMRRAWLAETPFFKSIRAKRRSCPD